MNIISEQEIRGRLPEPVYAITPPALRGEKVAVIKGETFNADEIREKALKVEYRIALHDVYVDGRPAFGLYPAYLKGKDGMMDYLRANNMFNAWPPERGTWAEAYIIFAVRGWREIAARNGLPILIGGFTTEPLIPRGKHWGARLTAKPTTALPP